MVESYHVVDRATDEVVRPLCFECWRRSNELMKLMTSLGGVSLMPPRSFIDEVLSGRGPVHEYRSPGIAPRRSLWDCFCCRAPGRDLGCTMEKGCDCGPHLRRCCRKCPKHCTCPPPEPTPDRRIVLED